MCVSGVEGQEVVREGDNYADRNILNTSRMLCRYRKTLLSIIQNSGRFVSF